MSTVYIAGPMTGYAELNHPNFAQAARELRTLGFNVISPAELNPIETPYLAAMKRDIRALLDCDHILLLEGWEKSKGATLERHIAEVLDIPVITLQNNGEPDMDRMGDKHIKPCKGCGALILWAKHFKANGLIGKIAPLVKAVEGEKPNIAAWYEEKEDQWYYSIGAGCEPTPREYVNHFSNCPKAAKFK